MVSISANCPHCGQEKKLQHPERLQEPQTTRCSTCSKFYVVEVVILVNVFTIEAVACQADEPGLPRFNDLDNESGQQAGCGDPEFPF